MVVPGKPGKILNAPRKANLDALGALKSPSSDKPRNKDTNQRAAPSGGKKDIVLKPGKGHIQLNIFMYSLI